MPNSKNNFFTTSILFVFSAFALVRGAAGNFLRGNLTDISGYTDYLNVAIDSTGQNVISFLTATSGSASTTGAFESCLPGALKNAGVNPQNVQCLPGFCSVATTSLFNDQCSGNVAAQLYSGTAVPQSVTDSFNNIVSAVQNTCCSSGGGLSTWAIIGIVVGIFCVLGILRSCCGRSSNDEGGWRRPTSGTGLHGYKSFNNT